MKISAVLIVLLIAVSLFFVSGQEGCQQEEETEFESSGLAMEFVNDAPSTQVNYGEEFPIYLDLKNNGGYDIDVARANLYLSGIGENLENVEVFKTNSVKLEKKTETSAGSERIKFAETATATVQLQNQFSFNMQLDSCYDYATLVETSICVGEGDSICSIEGDKIDSGTNTAGPVQVTSLTERIEGNKLYFDFIISNEGSGKVYLPDADCDKLQEDDLNEKQKQDMVEIVVRSDEGFTCRIQEKNEPYSSIDALEGAAKLGKVTCMKTLDTETHSAAVEIILTYKYRENLVQEIIILPA